MQPGRIETYVHSDKITQHKGACIVKITTQTDFAVRDESFIAFCQKFARFAFASSSENAAEVFEMFEELQSDMAAVSKSLKEKVAVEDIRILKL